MSETVCSKIYFRIFPTQKMVWDYVKVLDDNRTIYIRSLQELAKSKEGLVPSFWTFYTDGVFFNNSQQEIYDNVVPDVVQKLFQGHDAIIMAYGQTGSGKSLTINGLNLTYDARGILPRVASTIFEYLRAEAAHVKYRLQVSYVEFSKTLICDLLKSEQNIISNLKDLLRIKVKTLEEVFKLIFKGEGRKLYSENGNYQSNICTSVFTFFLNIKYYDLQEESIRQYKLHVIDFAGVDTVGNLSCLFKNPQDIGSANLAKSHLEQFFLVLISSISERIKLKQRLNPMIQYLGDCLKKTTILRLIGHIRNRKEDLFITISLLRFGELIKGIKMKKFEENIMKINDQQSKKHAKIQDSHLSQYNFLLHQNLGNCLNEDRMAHVERTISEYLNNKITQLTLLNVCDTTVAFDILKKTCKKHEEEKADRSIKETESPIKPRKSLSASISISNKLKQKSSRGSSKTGSIEKVTRRNTQERLKSSKTHSGSITSSTQNKKSSLQARSSSKLRSRTSISSAKRSSKRKSSASSVHEKVKSNEDILVPSVLPEQEEAWDVYVQERSEEYGNFVKIHKENETAAKSTCRLYSNEIEKLKDVSRRKDSYKNDLFRAKITKQIQYANLYEDDNLNLTEFEKCCMEGLRKVESDEYDLRELILTYQSKLKMYIDICNSNKKALQDDFNAFCLERFQVVVPNLEEEEMVPDIIETLEKDHEKMESTEQVNVPLCEEAQMFERFKCLIEQEKKKRRLYAIRNKQWSRY